MELICEIYYDGVQVGQGQGRPRKEAQNAAYNNIHSRLLAEPISQIVQGDKLPSQPESLPDYFEVIYKGAKPQEGRWICKQKCKQTERWLLQGALAVSR